MSDTRRQIAERHAYGETALMKTRSASILESAMSEYAAAVLEDFKEELSHCGGTMISLQYVMDQLRVRATQER